MRDGVSHTGIVVAVTLTRMRREQMPKKQRSKAGRHSKSGRHPLINRHLDKLRERVSRIKLGGK